MAIFSADFVQVEGGSWLRVRDVLLSCWWWYRPRDRPDFDGRRQPRIWIPFSSRTGFCRWLVWWQFLESDEAKHNKRRIGTLQKKRPTYKSVPRKTRPARNFSISTHTPSIFGLQRRPRLPPLPLTAKCWSWLRGWGTNSTLGHRRWSFAPRYREREGERERDREIKSQCVAELAFRGHFSAWRIQRQRDEEGPGKGENNEQICTAIEEIGFSVMAPLLVEISMGGRLANVRLRISTSETFDGRWTTLWQLRHTKNAWKRKATTRRPLDRGTRCPLHRGMRLLSPPPPPIIYPLHRAPWACTWNPSPTTARAIAAARVQKATKRTHAAGTVGTLHTTGQHGLWCIHPWYDTIYSSRR